MKIIINLIFALTFFIYPLSPADYHNLILQKSFPDLESEKLGEFLAHPYDLDFYKGQYFITDTTEGCIKVFSSNGKLAKTIGSKGLGPGELSQPYCIAINDNNGILYCYDGSRRISCFSTGGKFLKIIKTSLSIWDMAFCGNDLIATAYNKATNSLLVLFDKERNIQKFFGHCFDESINKLSPRYQMVLYGNASLDVNKDKIYVFYERLPFIQIFTNQGELIRTIDINIKEVQRVYHINKNPKPKGARMGIRSWLQGACVSKEFIYCYSPFDIGALLVINHDGELIEKMSFENEDEEWLIMQKFLKRIKDSYFFIDFENSQVNIYR